MKNNKTFYSRMIIALLLLVLLVLLPAISSDDDTVSDITSVSKVVDINSDGSVHINETIDYNFSGSYNTVAMDIPLRSPQSISNLTVDSPGYNNNVSEFSKDSYDRVTVRLYSDEPGSSINADSVNITYSYDYDYGLMAYYDVAEFEYMLWEANWSEKVDSINLQVNLPADQSNVEVWNNPPYYNNSISWTNTTSFKVHYDTSNSITTLEVRLIMPVNYITVSDKVEVFNTSAKEKIESDQQDYLDDITYNYYKTYAVMIISVILMLTPIGIYYRYGYQKRYNQEKSDVSEVFSVEDPLVLNLVTKDDLDKLDINAFYTTILELIDKGYFNIVSVEGNSILETTMKDRSSLDKYESRIVDYLYEFADQNGRISFRNIVENEDPKKFKSFLNNWYYYAYEKVHGIVDINDYYQKNDNRQFRIYSLVSIVLVIVMIVFVIGNMDPEVTTHPLANNFLEVLLVEAVIVYFLPKRLTNHWTNKAKEFLDSCDSFKEMLQDYDKLEKQSPENVGECGKIIVDLTALDQTDSIENINKYLRNTFSRSEIREDKVSYFAYSGLYNQMILTFESMNNYTSNRSQDDGDSDNSNKLYSETELKNKDDDDFWDDFDYYYYSRQFDKEQTPPPKDEDIIDELGYNPEIDERYDDFDDYDDDTEDWDDDDDDM